MRDLMKDLENVNGTYRHIVKVKKNLWNLPKNKKYLIWKWFYGIFIWEIRLKNLL